MLREVYEVPGIKSGWVKYKANALPTVLLLGPLELNVSFSTNLWELKPGVMVGTELGIKHSHPFSSFSKNDCSLTSPCALFPCQLPQPLFSLQMTGVLASFLASPTILPHIHHNATELPLKGRWSFKEGSLVKAWL